MFIVLEGIDGSGTTTQSEIIYQKLKKTGKKVILEKEPSDLHIGEFINLFLKKEKKIDSMALQMLFCADRFDHIKNKILPALKNGNIVICDRYFLSTIAYSSLIAKEDFFWKLSKEFLQADLTFFLNIKSELAIKRIKKRSNKEEIFDSQEKLETISKTYDKYIGKVINNYMINGEQGIEKIAKTIEKIVFEKIPK